MYHTGGGQNIIKGVIFLQRNVDPGVTISRGSKYRMTPVKIVDPITLCDCTKSYYMLLIDVCLCIYVSWDMGWCSFMWFLVFVSIFNKS